MTASAGAGDGKVTLSMVLSPLSCRCWCWWGHHHAGMDALFSWPCCPCWSSLHGHGCIVDAAAGSSDSG